MPSLSVFFLAASRCWFVSFIAFRVVWFALSLSLLPSLSPPVYRVWGHCYLFAVSRSVPGTSHVKKRGTFFIVDLPFAVTRYHGTMVVQFITTQGWELPYICGSALPAALLVKLASSDEESGNGNHRSVNRT